MSPDASRESTVLVTGAAGFVGRHLCAELAGRGWLVTAVTRFPEVFQGQSAIRCASLSLSSSDALWSSELKAVCCVVHLAGVAHRTGTSDVDEAIYEDVNVRGSRILAEQSVAAGVRRFVFLSSIKVNGDGGRSALYRARDVPEPRDAYARSKLRAEQALFEAVRGSATSLVIIRPPLIYGPGVKANFDSLMRLVQREIPLPFGALRGRRSFISIWNLSDFIETCMRHELAQNQTWLVSDGEDLSTAELVEKLARSMGKRSRVFNFSPELLRLLAAAIGQSKRMSRLSDSLRLDSIEARTMLNWRPPVSVDLGLERTAAAFIAAGGR